MINNNSFSSISAKNDITLQPNPTQDLLQVLFKEVIEKGTTISVIDLQGRVLYQNKVTDKIQSIDINTETLQNGLYFLQVVQTDIQSSIKFIIQH